MMICKMTYYHALALVALALGCGPVGALPSEPTVYYYYSYTWMLERMTTRKTYFLNLSHTVLVIKEKIAIFYKYSSGDLIGHSTQRSSGCKMREIDKSLGSDATTGQGLYLSVRMGDCFA